MRDVFQPTRGRWQNHAVLGERGVLDPSDERGLKNRYLDYISKATVGAELRLSGTETVLDFGCGVGRITKLLAPQVARVIGLDAFQEMVEEAKRRVSLPNVTFQHFDGIHIPFSDSYFDLVVSVWVFQYAIRETQTFQAMVKEISRVAKSGGRIILIEQGYKDSRGRIHEASEYIKAFTSEGCKLETSYPVRNGGTSVVAKLAYMGLVPQIFFPLCFWVERWLLRSKKKQERLIFGNSYVDYLFAFTKEK